MSAGTSGAIRCAIVVAIPIRPPYFNRNASCRAIGP